MKFFLVLLVACWSVPAMAMLATSPSFQREIDDQRAKHECDRPYVEILNYKSLARTRSNLTDGMFFRRTDGTSVSGYTVLCKMLESYDGNTTNDWKRRIRDAVWDYLRITDEIISVEGAAEGSSDYIASRSARMARIRTAKKQYITNIVHSLWVERVRAIPWSLRYYSTDEIEALFRVNELYPGVLATTSLERSVTYEAAVSPEKKLTFELYLMANRLIKKATQMETIQEAIAWTERNFFHATTDWPFDIVYGSEEDYYSPFIEHVFRERVVGCHQTATILAEILRTLNIPTTTINIRSHGAVYLPTIDRYVHGDHLADYTLVPPDLLLLTPWRTRIIYDEDREGYASYSLRDDFVGENYLYIAIELSREGRTLVLDTHAACSWTPSSERFRHIYERMFHQSGEYHLRPQDGSDPCVITSDPVPIRTLEELSHPTG